MSIDAVAIDGLSSSVSRPAATAEAHKQAEPANGYRSELPDHGLSTQELLQRAVLESYASAVQETILLYTLEFNHKSFVRPARVARWSAACATPEKFLCKLEDDAPYDPGQVVEFVGLPFEVKFPDKTEDNVGQFQFQVQGVGFELDADLEEAALSGGKITAILRIYVKGEELEGPAEVWPGINVKSPTIDATTGDATASGSLFDWLNRTFGYNYTPGKYPALGK